MAQHEGTPRPMADRAVEGAPPRLRAALPRPHELLAALGAARPAIGLTAAVAAVFLVHLPVLGNYFFNDDVVPLAEIASRSTPGYLKDLFLLDDLTPNWRFLTGLAYLAEYRTAGLDPFPYLLVNVLVHTATVALLFWLLWRALDAVLPAFFGATLFGLTAAHVPTVGQVTAFNNVFAAFFLMAALVTLYEGLERRRLPFWLAASVLCFAGAIAANESSAVSAPVLGLIVLWKLPQRDGWWRDGRTWLRVALVSAPFALLGIAAVAGFAACGCTEADLYDGEHIVSNLWQYLGRLLYPVGLDIPGNVSAAHSVAGPVVLVLALLAIARGPALGRIAAVWLLLAIAPYVPVGLWSAARYDYLAAAPFSVLAAVYAWELGRYATRLAPAAAAALALLAVAGVSLAAWQGFEQNQAFADATGRWRSFVRALETSGLDPEPGSTVYVRGGPVTEPLAQCAVVPAIGTLLWGDVKLFSYTEADLPSYRIKPGYGVSVFEYTDGRFVPVPEAPPGDSSARPLPFVDPEAEGNLCRLDVPLAQ